MYQVQQHIRFNELNQTQKYILTRCIICMYVVLVQTDQKPKTLDLDSVSLIRSGPRSTIFSKIGAVQKPVQSDSYQILTPSFHHNPTFCHISLAIRRLTKIRFSSEYCE